jgi:pimeloyl-ACP methyl ester carboxylesterase
VKNPPRNIPDRDGVVELADGRVLGFAEYGPSDGRAVLWFHGTPGACRQVPPDAPDLAREHAIRLIGIERPGTGRSTTRRYARVLDWAFDVEQFVDAQGIGRFAAVGLSGGGPFVLACARHMPGRMVAGAVLGGVGPTQGDDSAPGYTRALPPFERLLALTSAPAGELFSLALRPLAATIASPAFDVYAHYIAPPCDRPVLDRPDMKEAFLYDLKVAAKHGVRSAVHDLVLFGRDWGFRLVDIDVPVRFWHGEADKIVPLSHGVHQAALVPDGELTVVTGGGHFSGYETVDEVFDTLLSLWPDERGEVSA